MDGGVFGVCARVDLINLLMQEQSRQNSFATSFQQVEARTRGNLQIAAETDSRMRAQIDLARRRLTSVPSADSLPPNLQPIRPPNGKTSALYLSQTPQPQGFNRPVVVMPEEVDEISVAKLSRDLFEARRSGEQLRATLSQREAVTAQSIQSLQSDLRVLRQQNDTLRSTLSQQPRPRGDCSNCTELQQRVRQLEQQLTAASLAYDELLNKRTEANASAQLFRQEMNQRLQSYEERLSGSQGELKSAEQLGRDLQRKVAELQQRELMSQDEIEQLQVRLQGQREQFQREKEEMYSSQRQWQQEINEQQVQISQQLTQQNDYFVLNLQQLLLALDPSQQPSHSPQQLLDSLQQTHRQLLSALAQRDDETTQLQQRLIAQDSHCKRITDEYAEVVENMDRFQQRQGQLQRRVRQLEGEAEEREGTVVGQLRGEVQRVREELGAKEREAVELRSRLEESEHYVENVVKTAMSEQEERIEYLLRLNQQMSAQQEEWKQMVNTEGDSLLRQQLRELQGRVEQYEELLAKVNHQPADQLHRISQLEECLQAEISKNRHIEHERQQILMELKESEQTQMVLEQGLTQMEQQLREKEQLLKKLAEKEDEEEEGQAEMERVEAEWRQKWGVKEEEERRERQRLSLHLEQEGQVRQQLEAELQRIKQAYAQTADQQQHILLAQVHRLAADNQSLLVQLREEQASSQNLALQLQSTQLSISQPPADSIISQELLTQLQEEAKYQLQQEFLPLNQTLRVRVLTLEQELKHAEEARYALALKEGHTQQEKANIEKERTVLEERVTLLQAKNGELYQSLERAEEYILQLGRQQEELLAKHNQFTAATATQSTEKQISEDWIAEKQQLTAQLGATLQQLEEAKAKDGSTHAQLELMKNELGQANQRIHQLSSEVTQLNLNVKHSQEDIARVNSEYSQLKQENNIIQASKQQTTTEIQKLATENNHLADTAHQAELKIQEIVAINQMLGSDNAQLTAELQYLINENTLLKTQISSQTNETPAQAHIQQLAQDNSRLSIELQRLTTEIQRLTADNANLSSQSKPLISQIEQLKVQLQAAVTENTTFRSEVSKLTNDYTRISTDYSQSQQQLSQLTEENSRKNTDLERMSAEFNRVRSEYNRVNEEYSRMSADYGRVNEEYSRMSADYGKFTEEYNRMNEDYGRVNEEYNRMSEDYGRVSQQLSKVTLDFERSSQELAVEGHKEQQYGRVVKVQEEAELELRSQIGERQERMRQLYEENEELRHALHKVQGALVQQKDQKELEESLEHSRLQLVSVSSQNQAFKRTIAELNAALHQIEEEFTQLRNYAVQLEGQLSIRDEELTKLRAVPNNQAEVQQLKRQAVDLEEANSTLRAQLAQGGLKAVQSGQTADRETQQLKAKLADLQQAYTNLAQQLSEQQPQDDSELLLLREERESLISRVNELQLDLSKSGQEYEELTLKINQVIEDCDGKLASMDRYIKEEEQRLTQQQQQLYTEQQRHAEQQQANSKLQLDAQTQLEEALGQVEHATKEWEFYRGKLEEAEEYLAQTFQERDQLLVKLEEIKSVRQVESERDVRQIDQEEAEADRQREAEKKRAEEALETELRLAAQQIDRLSHALKEYQQVNAELTQQNQTLQASPRKSSTEPTAVSLQELIAKKRQQHEKELADKTKRIMDLETELKDISSKVRTKTGESQTSAKKIDPEEDRVAQLTGKLEEAEDYILQLMETVRTLQEQLVERIEILGQNEEERLRLEREVQSARAEIEKLRAEIEVLKADIVRESQVAANARQLQTDLVQEQQQIVHLQQQIVHIQQQLAHTQQQFTITQQQFTITQQELTITQQQLTITQQQVAEIEEIKQKLGQTEQQLASTQEQATQFQHLLQTAEQELDQLAKQTAKVTKQLEPIPIKNNLIQELARTQEQLQQAERKGIETEHQLTQQLNALQQVLARTQEQLQQAERKGIETEHQLTQQLNALQQELAQIRQSIISRDELVQTLQDVIAQRQSAIQQLALSLTQQQQKSQHYFSKLEEAETILIDLQTKEQVIQPVPDVTLLHNELQAAQDQYVALHSDLQSVQVQLSNADRAVIESQQIVINLTTSLQKAEQQIQQYDHLLKHAHKQNDEKAASYAQSEDIITQLKAQIEAIRAQPPPSPIVANWESILTEKEQIITDLSTELTFFREKLHVAELYIYEMQINEQEPATVPAKEVSQIGSKHIEQEELTNSIQQNKQLRSMNAEKEVKIKSLIEQNTAVHKECAQLRSQNEHLAQLSSRLQAENLSDKEAYALLQSRTSELAELADVLSQLELENTQLKVENTQIKEKSSRLQSQNAVLSQQFVQIQHENEANRQQAHTSTQQIVSLELERQSTQQTVLSLQSTIDSLQKNLASSQQNSTTNTSRTSYFEKENQLLSGRVTDLQKRLGDITAENESLAKKYAQSQAAVQQLKSENRQTANKSISLPQTTLQTATASLQNELQQQQQLNARLLAEKRSIEERENETKKLLTNLQESLNSYVKKARDSESQVQLLEEDKRRAEMKVRETKDSVQTIQSSLEGYKVKAREAEDQILKLEGDKKEAEKHAVESQLSLQEISKEANFFKNKLMEAESYINFMQNVKPVTEVDVTASENNQNNEIASLKEGLTDLEKKNRLLESSKVAAEEKLQKSLDTIKNLQLSLDNFKNKLRQTEAHILRLESERIKAEQKLEESQKLLGQANNEVLFFKNKLDEAQGYIFYLESNKTQQQTELTEIPIESKEEKTGHQTVVEPDTEFVQQLRDLRVQFQELSQREEQLAGKYEFTSGELNRHIENQAYLQQNIKDLIDNVMALEADRAALLKEKSLNEPKLLQFETLVQQITILNNEKQQIEAQLQQLSSKQAEGEQLRQKIAQLQSQLTDISLLKKDLSEADHLKKINEANIKQLKSKLEEATAATTASEKKREEELSKLKALENEVKQLKGENNRLSANVLQLVEEQRSWNILKGELNNTIKQLQQQSNLYSSLLKEKAEADARIQHLEVQLTQITSKHKADSQALETEINKLQSQLQLLESIAHEKDDQQIVHFHIIIQQKDQQIIELSSQLQKAEAHIVEAERHIIEAERHIKDLNISLEQTRVELKPNPVDQTFTNNLISDNQKLKQLITDSEARLAQQISSKLPLLDKLTYSEKVNTQKEAIIKELIAQNKQTNVDKEKTIKELIAQYDKTNAEKEDKENTIKDLIALNDKTIADKEAAIQRLISQNDKIKADKEAAIQKLITQNEKTRADKEAAIKELISQNERTKADKAATIKELSQRLEKAEKIENIPAPEVDNTELNIVVNKLLEAEDYIAHLQAEKAQLEEEKSHLSEEKAQFQRNQLDLENELISTEQKLSDNRQDSSRTTQQINALKQANADLAKQLAAVPVSKPIDLQAELQPLRFKIEQLEKTLQGKSSDHNVEIESLLSKVHENDQKVATLETTKRTLDDKVTALEKEVASLSEELEFFKKKLLQAESFITELESQDKSHEEIAASVEQTQFLQLKIIALEDRIDTLQKERDVLNSRITSAEQKVEELIAESEFFKKKLFEAEQYIVHLEEIRDSVDNQVNITVNQVSSESGNEESYIQELTTQLEDRKRQIEISHLNAEMRERENAQILNGLDRKVNSFQSALGEAQKQVEEWKEKALEAEEKTRNITHLIDKLEADIRAKEEGKSQSAVDAEFFKKKLLEAESYITELMHENEETSQSATDFESKLALYKTEINNLNDKVLQLEQEKSQLQAEIEELNLQAESVSRGAELQPTAQENRLRDIIQYLENQLQQQESKPEEKPQPISDIVEMLQTKVQTLEVELQQERQHHEEEIEDLNNRINETQNEIQLLQAENDRMREKATDSEAQLQNMQKILENLNNDKDEPEHPFQPEVSNNDIIKNKLLEAESYICELEEENENVNNAITALTEKLQPLSEEVGRLNEKINLSSQEKASLTNEIAELKSEREDLKIKLEAIGQAMKQNDEIAPLKLRISDLQTIIEREREVSLATIDELTQKLHNSQGYAVQLEATIVEKEIEINQINARAEVIDESPVEQIAEPKMSEVTAEVEAEQPAESHSVRAQTQSLIDDLTEQIRALKAANVDLESRVESLNEQIFNTHEDMVNLEADKLSLLQKQDQLTTHNQSLLLSIQTKTKQNEDLMREISNDIAINQKEVEELRSLLREKDSQAVELLKEKKNGEEKLRDAKIVIEQIRKDMKALNEELAEKDENIVNLQKALDDSQQRERTNAIQLQKTSKMLEESRSVPEQQSAPFFKQKLLEAESYISELQEENENINSAVEVLKIQISTLNEQVNSLNEKIVGNDAVNYELITENNQIKTENTQIKSEHEELSKKLESEIAVANALKEKLVDLKKELEIAQSKYVDEIEVFSNTLNEAHRQTSQVTLEKAAVEQNLARSLYATEQLQRSLDALTDTLPSAVQIQQKDEQIAEISREVVELRSEKDNLQVKMLSLEGTVAELTVENSKAQAAHQEIQIQIEAANKQLSFLKEQVAKFEIKCSETLQERQRLEERAHNSENYAAELADRSSKLQESVSQLEGRAASLSEKSQKQREQLLIVTQTLQKVTTENSNLIEKLSKSVATINGSVVQFQQAQTLIFSLQTQREQMITDLTIKDSELTQLRSEYEQRQIADEQREDEEKSILLVENDTLKREKDMILQQQAKLKIQVAQLKEIVAVTDKEIAELNELSEINKELAEGAELRVNNQNISQQGEEEDIVAQEGEDIVLVVELEKQVESLTIELECRDEENRQLKVENVNLAGELREIEGQYAEDSDNDNDNEDIQNHLVEIERENFELKTEIEDLQKNKAYLEYEISKLQTEKTDSDELIQQLKLQLAHWEQQPILQPTEEAPVDTPINKEQEELWELRQSITEEREQQIQELEVENNRLTFLRKDLEERLQTVSNDRDRLLLKLKDAEVHMEELSSIAHKQEEMRNQSSYEESKEERNSDLGHSATSVQDEKLRESINKIIEITNTYTQGTEPEPALQELESFPYLSELINSILYRLRLASAVDLEKALRITKLTEQLNASQTQEQTLQAELVDLRSSWVSSDRYDEVLGEVVERDAIIQDLQDRLDDITEELHRQQELIADYERQLTANVALPPPEALSKENEQLRKKIEQSEQRLAQAKTIPIPLPSPTSGRGRQTQIEFLNSCLDRIMDIEIEVYDLEKDIERVGVIGTSRTSEEEGGVMERLQELEEKLLKNANHIREHQERSDSQLFDLLNDLRENKDIPEVNRGRIEEYLSQLEKQIVREHEQHQGEVQRLKLQVAERERSHSRGLSEERRNRQDLLREINQLNSAMEIYHQEAMNRNRHYRRTLEDLLTELALKPHPQLEDKIRKALKLSEEEEARQMEEEARQLGVGGDFIISPNYMRVLDGDGGLSQLQESVGNLERQREEQSVQTEDDPKPFLEFLLSRKDIDKEDLLLLRRKVAELRSREVEESLQALRGQERKLEEIFREANRDSNPQQIENIMVTLANNYSRDEISQIFGSEDNDEILNKLNEALCLEDSFYRAQNSSSLMREIEERKRRYYELPTKLSEEVYSHVITLLSAKRDEEFYDCADSLFRSLYEIEDGFEIALRKKDEVYRLHNERMNQIFNRSSSDNSEEYLHAFEGVPEQEDLQVSSERKARRSDLDSEGYEEDN